MADAETKLKRGGRYPYDQRPPTDTAHRAALGVLADLLDRRGIKQAFESIDDDVRVGIVDDLASVIRTAYDGK